MTKTIKQFPHCDSKILHKPGECEYCDGHPDWQELRTLWNVNFTGHYDLDKMLCPAEQYRDKSVMDQWSGNGARTKEQNDAYYKKMEEEIADALKAIEKAEAGDKKTD